MYANDPEITGGWLDIGSPDSIDPGSGTTPDDYLRAVREDAGGATLRRLTDAMSDLSMRRTDDGSTVYTGTVRADTLAHEICYKEGRAIRVLPYGYAAHDAAADPASLIKVSVTVGADTTVQEIKATWGGASKWRYRLEFSDLGATPPPTVPESVRSLRALRGLCQSAEQGGPNC